MVPPAPLRRRVVWIGALACAACGAQPKPAQSAGAAAVSGAGAPVEQTAGVVAPAAQSAGAGGASGTVASAGAPRRLTSPPTYLGASSGNSDCAKEFRTFGFEPSDPGGHPLFLYFVGTEIVSADESSKYDSQAAARVTEAMARRGFVALSVEYDNGLAALLTDKTRCMFDVQRHESLIARLCALSNVDCARGIATWGHSQGALYAHLAANADSRVKAVWTTGYGGIDNPRLPPTRLRVVNGEADTMNASVDTLNKTSAQSCPNDGRSECLRADGSGWIIVRKAQCQVTSADHCWFDKRNCADNAETLEPSWVDRGSTSAFALERNADWVAQTLARP